MLAGRTRWQAGLLGWQRYVGLHRWRGARSKDESTCISSRPPSTISRACTSSCRRKHTPPGSRDKLAATMQTNRRAFLGLAATAGVIGLRPSLLSAQTGGEKLRASLPPPITRAERLQRIAKAQQLLRAAGLKALLVESGSSLVYFTGVQWRRSERLTAALIPAEGETVVVTPEFEEPSVRESLTVPAEVRVWNEHSSPFALLADWLKAHGAGKGPVGVEETTRFFAFEGLRALGVETRSDAGVVRTCRVIKSPAEIALLQAASDITVAAYRETGPQIARGMKPADISTIMSAAMAKRGGTPEFTLVLLGEASAYPHGSHKPQEVRPGEVVLMDCGC